MSGQISDQQLVERVQQGDKNAFNLLVAKYQSKVVKLISRYIRNQADVADVTQEAFIKAYRALANFRGDSAFYTWLYRIAVNTAKNYLTSQSRRTPIRDIEVEEAEYFEGNNALKESATPENVMISNDIQKVVFATLESLPNELRQAISLRELDGMSYDEIADVMECPVGTVRSRIYRARETIEQALKPMLEH